jgi:hypothetical protein
VPFTATPDDPEPMGRELFAAAVAGEFGPVGEYVPPPPAPAPVPASITQRQLLIALAAAGSISAEEAIAAGQTGAARIIWATMTEVYREDPLIVAIAAAAVATSEQVDELLTAAGV